MDAPTTEYTEAVSVTAAAIAAGLKPQALRARVKRGSITGAFKERRYDNPNARWFLPFDLAAEIVTQEGGSLTALYQSVEMVRPAPE